MAAMRCISDIQYTRLYARIVYRVEFWPASRLTAVMPAAVKPAAGARPMPGRVWPERRVAILLVVVMIDLSAVALVVPLLPLRMRALGVRPELVGLIGSVYSASQVLGGVVLGTMSDRISRTSILMLNFAAAATSYSMVGFATTVEVLLLSRVVVGLCKQTMTLATALLTDITTPADRPVALGQLRTATTLAWMLGQLFGGILAEHSQWLPAVVAVCQYCVAAVITWFFLDTSSNVATANPIAKRKPRRSPSPSPRGSRNRSHAPAAVPAPSVWSTAQKLVAAEGVGQLFILMAAHRLVSRGLGAMCEGSPICSLNTLHHSVFFLIL
jgi:MFS family permease